MAEVKQTRVSRQRLEAVEAEREAFKAELLEQIIARRRAELGLQALLDATAKPGLGHLADGIEAAEAAEAAEAENEKL